MMTAVVTTALIEITAGTYAYGVVGILNCALPLIQFGEAN